MPDDPRFAPIDVTSADGARFTVLRHGAHVTSWVPAGGDERLFLSARAERRAGAALRGGVPVIFPQFSDLGPGPRHGFARTAEWTLQSSGVREDGAAAATLVLRDTDATRAVWPHAFVAELSVVARAAELALALTVANVGDAPCAFTAALHTYLRVADVADVRVEGLAGVRFRDQAAGGAERVEDAALAVAGETDRVYLDAPPLVVRERGRVVHVGAEGFRDVVVWNPGAERAAALSDLEPDGWRRMLCVEAAAVGAPVVVPPGGRWTGAQRLTVRDA